MSAELDLFTSIQTEKKPKTPGERTRDRVYKSIYPFLPAKRAAVLKAILDQGESCINETALFMSTFPNVISGRFSELYEAGYLIKTNKTTYSSSGQPQTWYKVNMIKLNSELTKLNQN